MSLESWKSFFEFSGVVLLFLTFLFGAGLVIVSGRISEVKNREAAEASKALEKYKLDAGEKISTAQAEAGRANEAAGKANERAGKAAENAAEAQENLAGANARAAEADAKAESFRLDIAKANESAAKAQAQVAGATAEAAKANLDLQRIKSPRSLTNASALTDSLKTFKGAEYMVIGCFQDQESIELLMQIDKALTDAGWKRGKLSAQNSFGDIQLNISKDFAVPTTTRSGLYVVVQSTERVDALKAILPPMLPEYLRAAMALKRGLASGVSPPETALAGPLQVDPGSSTSVFVIVGKKP